MSVLLESDAGAGKTYLAEKLAEQVGFPLVKHDISQMTKREELLDLFDMIAAKQAEQDKPVFVFVDEINATLGGSPVYSGFLSPLEAGNYMRHGRRFELSPCVWMFAGTPEDAGKIDKEKLKDFKSRLTTIEKIDYQSLLEKCIGFKFEDPEGLSKKQIEDLIQHNKAIKRFDDEARLEQVYMGAQWINDTFGDVHKIDEHVLNFFHLIDPSDTPARKIKRLASSLENVQYGEVHKGNCTSSDWQDAIRNLINKKEELKKWKDKDKPKNEEWVEIVLN